MRIAMFVIGLALALGGIWVLAGKGTYKDTETAAKLGGLEIKTTTEKPVPAPVGYGLIAVGGVLLLAGALKKN
ncbi:MAG: hypothetical protein ABFC67_02990 [Mizugakiibacter sp.]|uniref:hypothetical protein n=1 Tax=Mizugakiibacter sp. TaxID=1972610 RepID=UPI0031C93218|nr:hypothetical protein [Xanthomonadaceae bacterium]